MTRRSFYFALSFSRIPGFLYGFQGKTPSIFLSFSVFFSLFFFLFLFPACSPIWLPRQDSQHRSRPLVHGRGHAPTGVTACLNRCALPFDPCPTRPSAPLTAHCKNGFVPKSCLFDGDIGHRLLRRTGLKTIQTRISGAVPIPMRRPLPVLQVSSLHYLFQLCIASAIVPFRGPPRRAARSEVSSGCRNRPGRPGKRCRTPRRPGVMPFFSDKLLFSGGTSRFGGPCAKAFWGVVGGRDFGVRCRAAACRFGRPICAKTRPNVRKNDVWRREASPSPPCAVASRKPRKKKARPKSDVPY